MNFDLKDPSDWSHILVGEVLAFGVSKPRSIRLTFNGTERFSVFYSCHEDGSEPVLLGSGDGLFDVTFRACQDCYVSIRSTAGAIVYFKGYDLTHTVSAPSTPSFVNIAPRGRPTELERMMYIVRLNEQARERKLNAELARVAAIRQHVAPAPVPVPAPAPPPAEAVIE